MPETLMYLYGIVPADAAAPPAELAGLEGGGVELLPVGRVAAVAGRVPAALYADDALNERLGELAWVGERGLAHERVLDWFAERGPVIPSSLFSLHQDADRLRQRVAAEERRYEAVLGQLAGRREWGIKLWRLPEAASHLDELSPATRALSQQIEAAPPGRRFLLAKKREAVLADELRLATKRLAHRAFAALGEAAERATAIPLPASAADASRLLVLHAAFLVPDAEFERFQRRVGEVAHELRAVAFEVEFTGPWPPYHFTEPDAA